MPAPCSCAAAPLWRGAPAAHRVPPSSPARRSTPDLCAVISFSIFIASMIATRSPSCNFLPPPTGTFQMLPASATRACSAVRSPPGWCSPRTGFVTPFAEPPSAAAGGAPMTRTSKRRPGTATVYVCSIGIRVRIGLVVRRGAGIGRERLQPLGVLEQVAAGLAARPLLRRQQRAMKADERRRALDRELRQRAQHARGRLLAIAVPDDELREHRVVGVRHALPARIPEPTRTPGPDGSS